MSLTEIRRYYFFYISLICHLLVLLSFTWVWAIKNSEPKPGLDIPAYIYKEPDKESTPVTRQEAKSELAALDSYEKESEPSKAYNVISISKPSEPVHLVGDKNIDKPLLTLLGKALARELVYPKIAIDFRIRGLATVGFLLFPDGHITHIQLLRSSGAVVLDEAALNGVHSISPVAQVDHYLSEPQFVVVGIIFG